MKKIFLIIFLSIFFFENTFAQTTIDRACKYKTQVDECVEANKRGWAWPRSIESFTCLSDRDSLKILTQIILDESFKKVDKEIENYIEFLESEKDYYFWTNSKETYIKAIDEIENKFSLYGAWSFGQKYLKYCTPQNKESIISQTSSCVVWWIPVVSINQFFNQTDCRVLAQVKLEIAKQVAYDVLKINKNQVSKDEKKKYSQWQRKKYNQILDILMINIWYVERIWKKWPSKTKNPHWS